MEENDLVVCLAALAQPMRLRIFRALVTAGSGGRVPGELARLLQLAPPTLSFHLRELARAELVSRQRHGRHVIYRAPPGQIDALLAYLKAHCCPDAGSLGSCVAASRTDPVGATGADTIGGEESRLAATCPHVLRS